MKEKFKFIHIASQKCSTTLKVMKISVLLFFLCFFSSMAENIYPQQKELSLDLKNVTLRKAISQIEESSDYVFMISYEIKNDMEKVVTGSFNKESIEQIMDYLLKNTSVTYRVVERQVSLFRNPLSKIDESSQTQQPAQKKVRITGIVTDAANDPLPGASVVLKGSESTGIATDINGHFSLEILQSKESKLVVSFIGMQTLEIVPDYDKPMNIVLHEDGELLDEVVVTGYQKIDRRLFTGSADKIKAEDAKMGGVTDIGSMLEGKAAGVTVQTVSGTFGTAPKIKVRGSSSIYGSQKPLWVVDGVILEDVVDISTDALSSGDAATLISSAVSGLNADDIEDFQILKDASATALYGARAMNGVIVVTTKKGRTGTMRVSYTGEFSMRMKPSYANYNIMNSQEQMSIYRELEQKGWLNHAEISRQSSGGIYKKMYDLINTYDVTTGKYALENTPEARAAFLQKYEMVNTDWFDVLFRNNVTQNHSISLSGGNDKSDFYFSTSYYGDGGWSVADKVDRFTMNANAGVKLFDRLSLRLTTAGSFRDQVAPGAVNRVEDPIKGQYSRSFDINPFSYAINTSRVLRPYGDTGKYEYYRMNYADFNILNELENNFINIDMMDLKMQADINLNITKGLDVSALGSIRYVKSTQEHRIMENSNMAQAYRANETYEIAKNNGLLFQDIENPNSIPSVVLPKGGFYNTDNNKLVNYYFRTTANYNHTFNDTHLTNFMGGFELKSSNRKNDSFSGVGYQYDRGGVPYIDPNFFKKQIQKGTSYYSMGEFYDRYVAFFATGSYSYLGRYTLNGTIRYDGSNQLGQSSSARWLPTWNVSAGWNVTSEKFMEPYLKTISNLSFRSTYGLTASMGPSNNSTLVLMNKLTDRPYASELETNMYIRSLANSQLTWEKQYETNIGFDLGLLKNRINLSADVYWRNGFDLIGMVKTSGIGGEAYKFANYADMKSNGFEFTLTTHNIKNNDFTWTTNITFAHNKSHITNLTSFPKMYDLMKDIGGPLQGYPVRSLFSMDFKGLNNEGLPTFINEKGELTVSDIDFQSSELSHLVYEGSIDPTITGGFGNTFKYKNWNLNVFLTYQFGNVVRLYPQFKASYSDLDAHPKEFFDRWKFVGDEELTNIPTIVSYSQYMVSYQKTYNAYNMSTERVASGAFIRMRDVSLTYNFDKKWISALKISDLALKLQVTNPFLIYSDKKLNGQDPEFLGAGGVAMPVPRQAILTLKLGF